MEHLSGEQIAALLDDGLSDEDRKQAEAHIAGCESCHKTQVEFEALERLLTETLSEPDPQMPWPPPTPDHLTTNQILQLADRNYGTDEARKALTHMAKCNLCRNAVLMARSLGVPQEGEHLPPLDVTAEDVYREWAGARQRTRVPLRVPRLVPAEARIRSAGFLTCGASRTPVTAGESWEETVTLSGLGDAEAKVNITREGPKGRTCALTASLPGCPGGPELTLTLVGPDTLRVVEPPPPEYMVLGPRVVGPFTGLGEGTYVLEFRRGEDLVGSLEVEIGVEEEE